MWFVTSRFHIFLQNLFSVLWRNLTFFVIFFFYFFPPSFYIKIIFHFLYLKMSYFFLFFLWLILSQPLIYHVFPSSLIFFCSISFDGFYYIRFIFFKSLPHSSLKFGHQKSFCIHLQTFPAFYRTYFFLSLHWHLWILFFLFVFTFKNVLSCIYPQS